MKLTRENAKTDVESISRALVSLSDVAKRSSSIENLLRCATFAFVEMKGCSKFCELDLEAKAEFAVFVDRFQSRLMQ